MVLEWSGGVLVFSLGKTGWPLEVKWDGWESERDTSRSRRRVMTRKLISTRDNYDDDDQDHNCNYYDDDDCVAASMTLIKTIKSFSY